MKKRSVVVITALILVVVVASISISGIAVTGALDADRRARESIEDRKRADAVALAKRLAGEEGNEDARAAIIALAALYPDEAAITDLLTTAPSAGKRFEEWSALLDGYEAGQATTLRELKAGIAAARRDIGSLALPSASRSASLLAMETARSIDPIASEERSATPAIAEDPTATGDDPIGSTPEAAIAEADANSGKPAAMTSLPLVEPSAADFKALALESIQAGNYALAIERLKSAEAREPGDAELHYMHAYALFKSKSTEVAETLSRCRTALGIDPTLRGAAELEIAILESSGDYGAAAEKSCAFMAAYPDSATVEYYAKTAALYAAAGKPGSAVEMLDSALGAKPGSIELCLLSAQARVSAGEQGAALDRIAFFLGKTKDDGRLAKYATEASKKGGDSPGFLPALESIQNATRSWEVAAAAGRCALKAANYPAAAAWFETAFETDPKKTAAEKAGASRALSEIARLKARSKDFGAAFSLCERAAALFDADGQVYLAWYEALTQAGRADEALDMLAKAADRGVATEEQLRMLAAEYTKADRADAAARYTRMADAASAPAAGALP